MRAFFRFLRGELLNSYYIKKLYLSLNDAMVSSGIIDELIYQSMFQWKAESEIVTGEIAVRSEDVTNLAKFMGIFKPIQYGQNTLGSIVFSESKIVNGKQRSERGLFNMKTEGMEYVRTAQDTYPDDIVNDATTTKREGLIPHGQAPIGYVKYGTDIYNSDGSIIWANILSSPPTDGSPYAEFYGEKFLVFRELFTGAVEMDDAMFFRYVNSITRINSNGPSLKELLYLTELLCVDYLYDLELSSVDHYKTLYYSRNTSSTTDNVSGRFMAWKAIVAMKYKNLVITERL